MKKYIQLPLPGMEKLADHQEHCRLCGSELRDYQESWLPKGKRYCQECRRWSSAVEFEIEIRRQ